MVLMFSQYLLTLFMKINALSPDKNDFTKVLVHVAKAPKKKVILHRKFT